MDVIAISLTADRQELTERAVQCFERQSYRDAFLLVYDTGRVPFEYSCGSDRRVIIMRQGVPEMRQETVGELRNFANAAVRGTWGSSKIFLHWDSDDWYHPQHIATLVKELQRRPGVGAVGYREACFWDSAQHQAWRYTHSSEAYCIGASLCYWASCWEQRRFDSVNSGEDTRWLRGVRSVGLSGFDSGSGDPLIVAQLHSGNTSSHQAFSKRHDPKDTSWQRAAELDARVQQLLEGK
jgi:hypothetical protein